MAWNFYKTIGLTLLFGLALVKPSRAQNLSNKREKLVKVMSDTIRLDTLSFIPQSITIVNRQKKTIDSSYFRVDNANAIIYLDRKGLTNRGINCDTLRFRYSVFPFSLTQVVQHKDIRRLQPDDRGLLNPYQYTVEKPEGDLFKTEGLTKNGSISRGIAFGNNQDLSVNSNLNLQVSGKLSDNVNILLAATDNSIPIQASGNTQQLQDFDKVFIQIFTKTNKLIAGDFETSNNGGYFLRFNKKAQGASFSSIFALGPANKDSSKMGINKVTVSAAVSRGSFGRNQIEGVEGNQGPYFLTGSNGEQFIVILSGTEKVYIDGILMIRGQENDYTIDYNTAQLTFTAKTLITKDKRIIVEFQYANNNFARSMFHFGDDYSQGNLKLHFNAYSESDSKNKPLQQQLSTDQIDTLVKAGNRQATSSGVDSVAWSNAIVLYAKQDTTIGLALYQYYVYSIDSTKAHFQLKFSQVAKGNYIQVNAAANGNVFKWVPPVGGVPQGNYEPVVLLIAPKSQQMVTFGADYKLGKNTTLTAEEAVSNYNQNTFSTLDKSTDVGSAFHFGLINNQYWKDPNDTSRLGLKTWKLTSALNYEYTQQYFNQIERYRSTEFERDWNLSSTTANADEHLISASFALSQSQALSIGYTANSLLEGSFYNAVKQDITTRINKKKFKLDFTGSLLNSASDQNTSFLRNHGTVSENLGFITIGIIEQQEHNQIRDRGADSLSFNSESFFEWTGFASNSDTSKIKYTLSYKQRKDYGAEGNAFKQSTYAQETKFNVKFAKNRNNQLTITSAYRTLEIVDTLISKLKPDQTLLGRIEHNFSTGHGLFTANTFYEVGSGEQVKQDYSYIQVAAGQGVYQWIDYNHDGIPELNEFEVAVFKDQADWIRVYTPTDQSISVYTNQFSEAVNLKPSVIWSNKKGIKKVLSLFSDQTTYRIDKKTTDNSPDEAYNPFHQTSNDTSLVSLNSSFRSSLYFNQLNSKYGIDFNYQDVSNKTLLTDGVDSRISILREVKFRWNILHVYTINLNVNDGEKYSNSEYFATRDYDVYFYGIEPKLIYQPNTTFRFSLSFSYTYKYNTPELGGQVSGQQNYGMEMRYNVLKKGNFTLKANFIQLSYNDVGNTPVAFEMLQGLLPGENVTWGGAYQRSLANNLTISLNYDGRKSEGTKVIHVGGAQVRASF